MKTKLFVVLVVLVVSMFMTGCSLFDLGKNPSSATVVPADQAEIQAAVAATMTAMSPALPQLETTPAASESTTTGWPTPVAIISGYGSSEVDYSRIEGMMILVRTDLPKNENKFYQRDLVPVTSPADLGIDWVPPFAYTSIERDFDVAAKSFKPWVTIVVDTVTAQAETDLLMAYADANKIDVQVTSVIVRIDSQGKEQECSVVGISTDPTTRRVNIYKGAFKFQTCDPLWTIPTPAP